MHGGMLKYCSERCNKRAYYIRKHKFIHSALLEGANLNSCTQKGLLWEQYLSSILGAECVSNISMNQDIDIIWNGCNIDVKSCNKYKRKYHHYKLTNPDNIYGWWVFNRNTKKDNIHSFLCVCLDNNKIVKIYLIPSNIFPSSGITIGNKSKYDKYLINLFPG
jgi:hypothetical protein